MAYKLNLADDGRVLSATKSEYGTSSMPEVNELPNGNIADYRYVDGVYKYDPIIEESTEAPEPTIDERVIELEAALEMLLSEVTE